MQQGLCTELVFSILTLITEHTSGECKQKYKDYDFTNMSAFTLENLLIADRTKFIKKDMLDSRRRVSVKPQKVLDSHNQKKIEDADPAKMSSFKQRATYEDDHSDDGRQDLELLIDKQFQCIEYAPDVFAHLRNLDRITLTDLRRSLNPELDANVIRIERAGEGMGKSGSFFFFSHDDRFLIKTMTLDDFDAFMKLFKTYFEHINMDHSSLMARIYGVYKVQMEGLDPVYLILMGNTKRIHNDFIKKIYDLKGSLSGREVLCPGCDKKTKCLLGKGRGTENDHHPFEAFFKNTACLKDINFLNLHKDEVVMKFHRATAKRVAKQLMRDVVLLSNFGLMDYSLLFVVSFNPKYVQKHSERFLERIEEQIDVTEYKQEPRKDRVGEQRELARPYQLKPDYAEKAQEQQTFKDDEYSKSKPAHADVILTPFADFRQYEREFLIFMSGFEEEELVEDMKIKLRQSAQTRTGIDPEYKFDYFKEELARKAPGDLTGRRRTAGFARAQAETQSEEAWREKMKEYLPDEESRYVFMSEDGMYLYHMGIIDYLQDYNLSKVGENKFKSAYKDGDLISAVPPPKYAERFINFMQKFALTHQLAPAHLKPKQDKDFTKVLREMQREKYATTRSGDTA